jgi:glycosyltransferase involved in cell wall biosynthesis
MGGAEHLLVTLGRFIDRDAFDLRVCSLRTLDDTSPIPRALHKLRIPVHALGGRRRHAPRHVLMVAALIWQHRIDVVHTHLPYASIIGVVAARLARRPVATTLHNINEVRPRPGLNVYGLAARSLRLGASVVIACAPEVGAEAIRGLGLPPDRVCVVPNAIDVRLFTEVGRDQVRVRRREFLGHGQGPLIVSVGNLLPGKGHHFLVEAMPRLLEAYPDAHLAIVGAPGSNSSLVSSRVAELGLNGRVILAGERDDVAEIMSAADVVAVPSMWEGLPLVVLEAMAAARPVVATSVGGVPGIIQDGVTGRLVRPGDADGLARAMRELLRDPDAAAQLGSAARARVLATYGADGWTQRLQTIYLMLASQRRATELVELGRPA